MTFVNAEKGKKGFQPITKGKTDIPSSAENIPTSMNDTEEQDSLNNITPTVQTYDSYKTIVPSIKSIEDVTVENARENPLKAVDVILTKWKNAEGRGEWRYDHDHITGRQAWKSTSQNIIIVTLHGETTIRVEGEKGSILEATLDFSNKLSRTKYREPEKYVGVKVTTVYQHYKNDEISDVGNNPARIIFSGLEPHTYEFYRKGKYKGKQVWRTLYDKDGKEVAPDGLMSRRARKRIVGDTGMQWPIGTIPGYA